MTKRKIRNLVERTLAKYGISGPPVDVKAIAESFNVLISERQIEGDVSGFLIRNTSSHYAVIGVNITHHSNRQRFTIAHELGHYLLHDGDKLHIDKQFAIGFRNGKSSEGKDAIEREANAFAAELLMPKIFIQRDIIATNNFDFSDDHQLQVLADKYGVSVTAMTYRLANLGYIDLQP